MISIDMIVYVNGAQEMGSVEPKPPWWPCFCPMGSPLFTMPHTHTQQLRMHYGISMTLIDSNPFSPPI